MNRSSRAHQALKRPATVIRNALETPMIRPLLLLCLCACDPDDDGGPDDSGPDGCGG